MESKGKLDFDLSIRPMRFEEVEDTLRLFGSHGYYDSLSVVQAYYENDPSGFVVAIDQDRQKVIGGCAAPITTHRTCFVGAYVMDAKYQGLGIGVQLFNRCMDNVGDKNCGLWAVPQKFSMYKNRAGFKLVENVSMLVVDGKCEGSERLKTADKLDSGRYRLQRLGSADYDQQLIRSIVDYDQKVHLECRDKLLRKTFIKSDITTVAVLDRNSEHVVGYGCIKPNIVNEAMVGPLYANSADIAEIILAELIRADCTKSINNGLVLITTDNSAGGLQLIKTLLPNGNVTRCAKLYTKNIPPFNYEPLYFCHTPDFSC